MQRRGLFGSALSAAVSTLFVTAPSGAQQDTPRLAPAMTPSSSQPDTSATDGRVVLRGNGTAFDLEYSNARRRRVFDAIAVEIEAVVEWHSESAAAELISGRHKGTLDEILDRLLAGRNYITTYESVGSVSRIKQLIIQGNATGAPVIRQNGQPTGGGPVDATPACAESGGVTANHNYGEIELDNGKVVYAGGIDNCGTYSRAAELFDPTSGTADPTGQMSIGRSSFPMVKLPSGDVIAFGGESLNGISEATDRIERYSVQTGQWTVETHLKHGKGRIATCSLKDGSILLVGGGDASTTRSAEIYDPVNRSVEATTAPSNFEHLTSVKTLPLQDGRCLVASEGTGVNLEVFNPAMQRFTSVAIPPDIRTKLSGLVQLGLLPNGTVLIVASHSMTLDLATNTYRPVP